MLLGTKFDLSALELSTFALEFAAFGVNFNCLYLAEHEKDKQQMGKIFAQQELVVIIIIISLICDSGISLFCNSKWTKQCK